MGRRRTLVAVLAAGAAVFAWPVLGHAATLSISQAQHAALVSYTAAPGETNIVQISLSGGSHWNVSDSSAPIVVQGPTSGQYGYCKSVDTHQADCTALGAMANFRVHLGDGNDRFVLNASVDTQTEAAAAPTRDTRLVLVAVLLLAAL